MVKWNQKVNYKIPGNPSCHVLQRVENNGPSQLLIGHKRTGDEGIGRCIDHFAGYLYDIAT